MEEKNDQLWRLIQNDSAIGYTTKMSRITLLGRRKRYARAWRRHRWAHDLGLGVDAVPLGVSRRAGSCALVIAEPLLLSWIEGT